MDEFIFNQKFHHCYCFSNALNSSQYTSNFMLRFVALSFDIMLLFKYQIQKLNEIRANKKDTSKFYNGNVILIDDQHQ